MNAPTFLSALSALCAGLMAMGALMTVRRNVSGWAFAAGMLALAADAACGAASVSQPAELAAAWERRRLFADGLIPGAWLLFSLTYARGNAREFLGRWKIGLAAAFLAPVAVLTCGGWHPLQLAIGAESQAPGWFTLSWSGVLYQAVLLACSILILSNLERTFRASVGTVRWRIKFTLMAVGLIFVVRVYTTTQAMLFHSVALRTQSLTAVALLVAAALALRGFFRTKRIELDVYPSQAVLQGSITILLAGVYLVVIGITARLVRYLGGGHYFALEALWILVSLVLFVVLLQSDRLRMRLSRLISQHFQRPIFDYRVVWRRFTDGTASQVDQTELCRSLVKLVADVFQCLSVAIWIVDDRQGELKLAASTSLSEARGKELALGGGEASAVIAYFKRHPDPADIEMSKEESAALLRRIHPSEFPRRENRVCAPMIGQGRVLALMVVGDRVGGTPFSAQDLDMLKCAADHAAASLLNVQLAQRLLQAKELEAFQTMAAFFVHDLKNAASTLSLMLKNLPVHFEDPAFREDALRGVGKSVSHINHVIGRLSLLRSEMQLRTSEEDLNAVVEAAVTGLDAGPEFAVIKELAPLPPVLLDRAQFAKVVTNLVLNAKEATPGHGQIRLTTGQENGWAVLQVRDHGCGMSKEFIASSLFRPFQSTKKNGLGIGMFQSKTIVELHGGRIAVDSQPGDGTTFQVYLPLHAKA